MLILVDYLWFTKQWKFFLIISGNSNAWAEQEKEEIVKSAIKRYLGKRRTKQVKYIRQPIEDGSMLSVESDKKETNNDDSINTESFDNNTIDNESIDNKSVIIIK